MKLSSILPKSLLAFMCVVIISCSSPNEPEGQRVVWLKQNAVSLKSIDLNDTDFSDLQPLKDIIGDAKIVLLGEETHGDGTAFLTKARLVRFLHQEMGFDVLAFESGLYDCAKVWELIERGGDPITSAQQGIFSIWSASEQVKPLFQYIGTTINSGNPLELAGFDSQFTGVTSTDFLISDLETFLRNQGSLLLQDERWATFIANLAPSMANFRFQPPQAEQVIFFSFVQELQNEVAQFNADAAAVLETSEFWEQMLRSIEGEAVNQWSRDFSTPTTFEEASRRDLQMARNLIWLSNEFYPNRKIIAWAATLHIIRNMDQIDTRIEDFTYNDFVSMGHTVWQELGEQIYALGFTTYSGSFLNISNGTTFGLDPSLPGSLEYVSNSAGLDNAIIDFRNISPGGEWLRETLISRPLGYAEMNANWPTILDGMVFNKIMQPSIRNSTVGTLFKHSE